MSVTNELNSQIIADMLGGEHVGDVRNVASICTINHIAPNNIMFVKSYDKLAQLNLAPDMTILGPMGDAPNGEFTVIKVENPRFDIAKIIDAYFYHPELDREHLKNGIAENAIIDETAFISVNCTIGRDSVIGKNVVIEPGVYIGPRVKIGDNSVIRANSVIGGYGFGFEKDEQGVNHRIPHIGGVEIGQNVEVGALTSICSGTIDPTRIADNCKLDDHVFIAHNCQIAENCMIIACAEVSGSVKLGKGVWVGPNATLINGISIGDDSFIGIGAAVTKSFEDLVIVAGNPAKVLRKIEK
ncbi:hypothetical protein LPB140_06400 [Sphingorhabdus lutea]|uniref:UDP-3-O-(3-hydroxymyristoyl)glucosamine N-acyltransferase n=1 Tax=Sphingorhabdus lutea TaxID=1913578 RepID=A0A1L3JBF7_9SPHN|nr:UDP-3-O-(3-hydroxymyristoyl)glucosamine N-acyltransferase [Sphingorhabdus lutea]APG62477.1 hypothetical protein LPB140_06400 [Sphingorhabdus lutea]